jgi:hypothetical protein
VATVADPAPSAPRRRPSATPAVPAELQTGRLVAAHAWVAFAAFAVACLLGVWQMWARSPLAAPAHSAANYFRSVTLHGVSMAFVLTTFFIMAFGYFVAETALKNKNGLNVIIGPGTSNQAETIDLSRHAQDHGADGLLVIPPFYFNNPPLEGLTRYYSALFEAVKMGPVAWADRVFKGTPGTAPGWRQGFGILFDDLVAALLTLLVIAWWKH